MTQHIRFSPELGDDWRARARDVIPGGASTGSKRPDAVYGSRALDPMVPTHYERAEGCTLFSPDGRSFIDCTMALGAVALSYADRFVTRAVVAAAEGGNVAGLPHRLEVEVAERLVEVIPCAEQVRFLRTGAEATAAAVRIARAVTGRTRVIACGYFGWLDWSSDALGVPQSTRDEITWIAFDDIDALRDAVGAHSSDLACIIVEPLIHRLASLEWLQAIRAHCDAQGAVMILDEIKTGFRIRTGGVQEALGIVPDLTALGKALANGYPLAAVVGRAGVIEAATRTWISSTAAAESTGLAAANAVLDWHDRIDVPARLARIGADMRAIIGDALAGSSLAIRVNGADVMWQLESDDAEKLDALVVAAAHEGVLLKRGAYQFAALAHDDEALDAIAAAMARAVSALQGGPRRSAT